MASSAPKAADPQIALCTRFPAAGDVVKKWGLDLLVATFRRIRKDMESVLVKSGVGVDAVEVDLLGGRLIVVAAAGTLPDLCRVAMDLDRLVSGSNEFPNGLRAQLGQAIAPCDVLPAHSPVEGDLGWTESASGYLADRIASIAQRRQILLDEAALVGLLSRVSHLNLAAAEEVDLQGVQGTRRIRSIGTDGRPQNIRNLSQLRPQLKRFEDRLSAVMADWQALQEPQSDLLASDDSAQDRRAVFARSHDGFKAISAAGGPLAAMLDDFNESKELSREADIAERFEMFLRTLRTLVTELLRVSGLSYDALQNAAAAPIIELMSRGYEQLSALHRLADSLIKEGDGVSVLDPPNRRRLSFDDDTPLLQEQR